MVFRIAHIFISLFLIFSTSLILVCDEEIKVKIKIPIHASGKLEDVIEEINKIGTIDGVFNGTIIRKLDKSTLKYFNNWFKKARKLTNLPIEGCYTTSIRVPLKGPINEIESLTDSDSVRLDCYSNQERRKIIVKYLKEFVSQLEIRKITRWPGITLFE